MTGINTYRRCITTIFIIVLSVLIFIKCINTEKREAEVIKNSAGDSFAGSAKCGDCHKSIYDTHIHTAHFLTSNPAAKEYIKGSFETGKNTFAYNDSVKVVMEEKANSFYQAEYINDIKKINRRFDIVVGSGAKGQSYLNWRLNGLSQLPITYFTPAMQWSNSPGYPDAVVFNRPITSRCLECHTTYAKEMGDLNIGSDKFFRNQIIYGVDCEKCHGPGEKHVQFHSKNLKETTAKYIVNPSQLSRQQNLDMCALCHGGRLTKIKPSFQFKAGNKLADFFIIDTAPNEKKDIDVHGNQYGLLASSKCFRKSEMTCSSCHNTHENERGKMALFSSRCINCHNTKHENLCKLTNVIGSAINNNCIDCHMPKQPSKSIAVLLKGAKTPLSALIRTHFIKIYPDESKEVLAAIKQRTGAE